MALLNVFISSPGDVAQERAVARRVLGRVQAAYAGRLTLEPVLWEQQPLLATQTFQSQLAPPSACDIVVAIVWSRIGTPLPEALRRPDGSRYQSGTEYEIEDALGAAQRAGRPRVLLYRKTAPPERWYATAAEALEAEAQRDALAAFLGKWTRDERDGSFRAAFHPFASTAMFEELLELHLHRLVRELVPDIAAEDLPAVAAWTFGSPFRGLASFEFEHAALFFGRTGATSAAVERLRTQGRRGVPFLLLLGMSGGGKSSLAKAGVLPMLMQPGVVAEGGRWRWGVMRPGEGRGDLVGALAHALATPTALSGVVDPAELAAALRADPQAAAARLAERNAGEGGTHVALVVDQLEEMFSDAAVDDGERQAFAAALDALVRGAGVWTVATLRSDFYPRLVEVPALVALKEGGQFDVVPPEAGEVAQMIRLPAAAAGLRFEQDAVSGERLDERLRDVMVGRTAALPLLQFTLDELYQRRSPEGLLTFAAYEAIGGLEGALAHRAEEVFAAQSEAVRAALPDVLEPLVAVGDEDENVRRRQASWAAFADPPARALVQALIEARLLATDLASDGSVQIGVTHEALVRHWPRAAAWLRDNRELLRIRERVRAASLRWDHEGRRSEYLLQAGKPLAEAQALGSGGVRLDALEREFVAQSQRRAQRNRRLRQGAVAGLAVLSIVASIAAVVAVRQADAARREATTASRTSEFLTSLFALADPGEDRGNRVTARELLARGAEQIRTELRDEPLVRAALLNTMGVAYSGLGLFDEAQRLTAEATDERTRQLGAAHPDTLRSRLAHAVAMYQAGEYGAAEATLRDVQGVAAKAFAPGDVERIRIAVGLGDVLTATGKAEEALPVYEAALREVDAARADRRRERVYALSGLGLALYFQGRLDDAQGAFTRARALGEEVLGPKHPKVLESANNLASIGYQKGAYRDANALWQALLPRYREVYGPEHAEVALVLNNLGRVALIERRFDDAMQRLDEALQLDRRYKGPRHDDLILPLNSMGLAALGLGRRDEARRLFDEALGIAREHDHWMAGVILTNVADLEARAGALEAAERAVGEARAALEAAFPADQHKEETWRYDLLAGIEGDIRSRRGRYAAAEPALVRNVERMAERFGEHSLFAVDALRRAADHFQRAGDTARAAALRARQQRAEAPAT